MKDIKTFESISENMKAISIKQPWAYLIAAGVKDIENRSWKTNYRGTVLIHTGAKYMKMINPNNIFTNEQWNYLSDTQKRLVMSSLPTSAIIGSMEIVDCVKNNNSIWAEEDSWNWIVRNQKLFDTPILNVKGKLSFFTPIY